MHSAPAGIGPKSERVDSRVLGNEDDAIYLSIGGIVALLAI